MDREAIPPEEVKVLDINSSFLGVRTVSLMENAGAAVAKNVIAMTKPGNRIAVVCGRGNNGGDGFVAARHVSTERPVDVYLVDPRDDISTELARVNFERIRDRVRPLELFNPRGYDLVVDAMLGVGARGTPSANYSRLIGLLNESGKTIVSIDVPSGWPSDLRVRPDVTIALHAPKVGMDRKNSGRIVVEDIGIPQDAVAYCGPGDFALLPKRKKNAHKGDAGRVLVIGGGPYTGAPAFAGMAAMRTGVDLTFAATPESAALPVAIYSPNIIVRPLDGDMLNEDHVQQLLELSRKMDVVAIGPGLGAAKETLSAVQEFVAECTKPLVVDADAIAACGQKPRVLRGKSGVITPHAGEFKKLTGKTIPEDDARKMRTVKEAAARFELTILLKGPLDVMSDGRDVKLNRVHNEAMTVGGTGDVLTGIVAALIAQKATPFAAARIGAFTAGFAGNLAFEERGYGLLATDVIEKIPFVLRRYL